MSRFTAHGGLHLRLREDEYGRAITEDGRATWEVLEPPLVYEVGELGSGQLIVVPAGFATDLASIPWPARGLLPPDGPWAKAAVVHDYLYRTQGWVDVDGAFQWLYDREDADKVFREAMEVVGVPPLKRDIIYRAVRWFGGRGWGR